MKLVKNAVFAGLLLLAITFNTFAGDQQMPAGVQPTPTPTPDEVVYEDGTSSLGDPCFEYTGEITTETSDYLYFEALVALLSVY